MREKRAARELSALLGRVAACRLCFPRRDNRPVPGSGPPVRGGLFFVGQAPGIREPEAQRMFAWTAGKRLFTWLSSIGLSEEALRAGATFTAVARCFPGKSPSGRGDLRPWPEMVENCSRFLEAHLSILAPRVVVPIGGLAIERLLGEPRMTEVVGREFRRNLPGGEAFLIPLPHPSGASPWIHDPANRRRLSRALSLLRGRLKREGLFQGLSER